MTADLRRSWIVRLLFTLRGIRLGRLTLADLERIRFVPLEARPPADLTLGLIGRFWTLSGGLRRFAPEAFPTFEEPGFARAVWSFRIAPHDGRSRLATETRVRCTDETSRKRFLRYWRIVGPFSGLVRRELLRLVRDRVRARP